MTVGGKRNSPWIERDVPPVAAYTNSEVFELDRMACCMQSADGRSETGCVEYGCHTRLARSGASLGRATWCRANCWRSAIEGVRTQDSECELFIHWSEAR